MEKNKARTALAKGSDPLEIKCENLFECEDIDIKTEPADENTFSLTSSPSYHPFQCDHTYFVKEEEKFDINFESNPLLDQSENYPPGIERIVDINDLLRNKDTTSNSSALSPKRETVLTRPEDLENTVEKEPPCGNCMRNIEHFCIACKKSWNYKKDTTLCSNCQSILKLQCKICHKRFKFLNKIHQYVLQASKKLNLLSREKKQVTFTCEKKQNFICSKCKYKTTHKKQLTEHTKKVHGQITATHSYKKSSATILHSETTINDKPVILNSFSNSNDAESPCMSNVEHCIVNSPKISNLNNSFKTSNIQNLAQEVAQAKKSKRTKNPKKPPEINFNQDADQYIELFCSGCKKTCKKVTYDEVVKPVCRECQQLMLYRCTLCTSRYKLLKYVRLHVKRVCWRRINEPQLNCTHCDYKAEVKSRLEFHIKSEHMPKNCPKCHKEVENAATLKVHIVQCAAVQNNRHGVVTVKHREADLDDVPLIIRQRELMLKNYLNEKLPIDDDDSYTIIKNDPEVLINQISKKHIKNDTNGWRSLVDYYCLQCDGEAKKKFSKFRPRCPKCKIKYDYRCISCEKLYGGYNTIYRHVQQECQNRFEMGCNICDYTSTRKYLLLNHIKSKHAIYKCLRCNCRCDGYLSLRKHQSNDCKIDNPHGTMHVNRLIAVFCKFCYKRSRRPTEENELVPCDRCTTIMNYQCLKCNKLFDDREVTYKHVKEECKPTFLCDKCDYKAYIQYDLDIHIKYVHTIRRCQDCGVQFKDEYIFRLHRIEELKKKERLNKQLAVGIAVPPEPKRIKKSKEH